MAIRINQRLAAPSIIPRAAVTIWTGWEFRQETINNQVCKETPTNLQAEPQSQSLPAFAMGAALALGKEGVS